MSDSVWPHRQQPTRLPRPWDSPGKNTGVGCYFLLQCRKVKSESEVTQLWPTLRDSMDCSLPGSSVHGIFQARVLEWGAVTFSRVSSKWKKIPQFYGILEPIKALCIQNTQQIFSLIQQYFKCKKDNLLFYCFYIADIFIIFINSRVF